MERRQALFQNAAWLDQKLSSCLFFKGVGLVADIETVTVIGLATFSVASVASVEAAESSLKTARMWNEFAHIYRYADLQAELWTGIASYSVGFATFHDDERNLHVRTEAS